MFDSTPVSATVDAVGERLTLGRVDLRDRRWGTSQALRTPGTVVGLTLTGGLVGVALLADILAPGNPSATVGVALQAPTLAHPLGTDDLGRDLASGLIHGIRTSLIVALGVAVLALPIGLSIGVVAGARGGWLDDLVMRFSEIWQVLPRFFLALMVIALFGPGLDRVVLVLGLTSWALLARIARAEVLSLREREFVDAARALGGSEFRVVTRHMLPHVLPAVIVYVALLLAQACLVEATLGFLGLGDPNVISLGYLAAQAQRFLRVAWWMWLFPGVALISLVIGLNLLADALTDRIRAGR